MSFVTLAVALVVQQATLRWSAPEELFASPRWTWSALDADAWGAVHVVWTGEAPAADGGGPAIFHTHLSDGRWSPPAVLFSAPPGYMLAAQLDLRSTADGWLHLVWTDRAGVHLSRAPCSTAVDRASWEEPRKIADAPGSDQVQLAARGEHELHLLVTRLWGDDGRKSGVVEHLRSADGGATWSPPRPLSAIGEDPVTAAGAPRLLLDGPRTVHAIWDERSGPNWLGDRIVYTRSGDDGATWERPQNLSARGPEPADRRTAPSIAATAGNLQIVYTCDHPAQRCERVSSDGGATWSAERHFPIGGLVGFAEWDALLADAAGNLHFVAALRAPRGMYYLTKMPAQAWTAPLLLDAPAGWDDAHAPHLALSLGNQLHVVWNKNPGCGDILHAVIQTGAPASAPAPAPPPPRNAGAGRAAAALVAAITLALVAFARARRRRR